MTDTVLTDDQVESFIEHGHVTIPGCFTREDAQPLLDEAWIRLGYDPHDPRHLGAAARPHAQPAPPRGARLRAEGVGARPASCSAARSASSSPTRGATASSSTSASGPIATWEPPSAVEPGWHKDGDFFRHFLDSPEQGLLTHRAVVGHRAPRRRHLRRGRLRGPVARLLAEHREGILPDDFDYDALIAQCTSFVETTGRRATSSCAPATSCTRRRQNHRGAAAFHHQPADRLASRCASTGRTPPSTRRGARRAARAGRRAPRLPAGGRAPRTSVPERVLRQQRMSEEEQARLAARPGVRAAA